MKTAMTKKGGFGQVKGAFRALKRASAVCSNSIKLLFLKTKSSTLPLSPLCLILTLLVLPLAAQAHSFKSGDIRIGHPWAKPTAEGANEAQVYMSFLDTGTKADQLQSAATSVAQKAVLVQAAPNGDLSEVAGIDLPPQRGVSLRPGDAYVKLTGLKGGLVAGDKFTLRLKFANAAPVDVTVFVQDEPGESTPDHDHDDDHHHDHDGM